MTWLDRALDFLKQQPICGYAPASAPATEPTALAALALLAHGEDAAARKACNWLADLQQASGSVSVRAGEDEPGWPTSLAVLAWHAIDERHYSTAIERAAAWILSARGETLEQSGEYGHNTEIAAWSWAESTHSWIEPTAFHVFALKATGHADHPRVRDGVRMLLDRQLPAGGCNYGNTVVLGQTLRPHVQPTGIALLALRDEKDRRITKSVAWLLRSIGPETTAVSLAWALLGLRRHDALPAESEPWLAAAAERVMARDQSPHKLALLALAAKGWPT